MHTSIARTLRVLSAALLTAFAILLLAPTAWASEQISTFSVAVELQNDGTVLVVETIEYDFGTEQRRGIIRDIPLADELPDGNRQLYSITDLSVLANGAPVPTAVEEGDPYLTLRIGDPDVTVTGVQEYRISYRVSGALTIISADDISSDNPFGVQAGDVEFYWDLIGTEWEVLIDSGSASVTGPADAIASQCFTGVAGSTQQCPTEIRGATATFGPVRLSPGSALTGTVAYPRSAFTSLPEPNIVAGSGINVGTALGVGGPLALLALLAPPLAVLGFRNRLRGAHEPLAPVQFGPPHNLRPAQISAGLDGVVDARAVLATLLDLVSRKWITLSTEEGRFLGKDSLVITWLGTGTDELSTWEDQLLTAILKGQENATLKGYDAGLATAVTSVSAALKGEAVARGRFNATGTRNRTYMRILAIVGVGIIVVSFTFGGDFFGSTFAIIGSLFGAGLAIGGVIAGSVVPRRQTQSSAKFAAEAEGFKRFLDTDPGAARRELVQRLGLPDYAVYATMLPYAVVFDLESSWSGAFPDLTEADLHRSGLFVANTYMVSQLLDSSISSVRTASTNPSRSGGSGFSGGSSGGGGGGGGGRSW
jgi:uncharacterized membrane protein YgcG